MTRLATRSPGEREDAEAERLVRPAPKKKPPRHDRRREEMSVDEDVDTDGDPDLKGKDRSLNYKTIGGAVVERVVARYAAEGGRIGRIPARNRQTGKVVFISEKSLRENPEKYEKYKPEKDEKRPGTSPDVKAPPPPDAPTGGPPKAPGEEETGQAPKSPRSQPPPRRKPDGAPKAPEPTTGEEPKGPEDQKDQAPQERKEKGGEEPPKPEPSVSEKLGLPPPRRREVSAEEQAEVTLLLVDSLPSKLAAKLIASRIHPDDAKVVIRSFRAAQSRPVGNLSDFAAKVGEFYETDPDRVLPPKSWRSADGKKVAFDQLSPEDKSSAYRQHQWEVVAMSNAAQGQLEERLTFGGKVPEQVSALVAHALLGKVDEGTASKLAEQVFDSVASAKDFARIPEGAVEAMLGAVKNEHGQTILRAYLQANDYKRAKKLYLNDISERDKASKIADGLRAARDFFAVQGKFYGDEKGHAGAKRFETKTLAQLRELSPEKYASVRKALDEEDANNYRKARKQFERAQAAYDQAIKAWKKDPFGGTPPSPPPEPVEPLGYSNVKKPDELASEGRQLWKELQERSATTKMAARVASRVISSYPTGIPMHRTRGSRHRRALYHGTAPGPHYPSEPYPKWGPVPPRDLADSDYDAILASAKTWLNAPLEGADRAQRAREALDLALADGHHRLDVHAYDLLLDRLLGTGKRAAADERTQLERAVYAKFPPDSKRKAGGRLTVMLTGDTASKLKRPQFELVALSELTQPELQTLAKTMRVVTSSCGDDKRGKTATRDSARDSRKPDNGARQMLRLSSEQKTSANQILASFDQLAQSVQQNYQKWGMSHEAAKSLVNRLDRTADAAEALFFGQESLNVRQAEVALDSDAFVKDALDEGLLTRSHLSKAARVLQRESDEPYMDTFKNPMSPIQTDSDEPYMSAYGDDQSSAVLEGRDDTGRDLAPEA